MKAKLSPRRPEILSPDEEGILAVLREIAAAMRERGQGVTAESFGPAVIAAGATRTPGSDGDPLSAYALGGVRFMVRDARDRPGFIEISFLIDSP